jgi:APA family basic amino acid/polyamine antiporter
VGYGDVGSSIFYTLGLTALYALGAAPIALLLAGLVFICTCLTYAEMSTTFPEPGGSATFSRYAFNDLISFVAGWGLLLDYILTIAISAFAIAPYLQFLMPLPYSIALHLTITVAIILALFGVNFVGVKYSGRLSFVLAIVSVVSQLLLIAAALIMFIDLPILFRHLWINVGVADWSPTWGDFLKGTAMAMVAYTGIESIAQLAAETRKPALTIPKAIKWTMSVLVFLYVGLSMVALSVLTPQELGTTYVNHPIEGMAAHLPFGGHWLGPWFGIIAALLLLIASNAGLIGCSRLVFSMGEYYQVPHFFYQLHPRFRTPYVSLAFFTLLSCLVVLLSRGSLAFLADLYNFGAQIAFFFAHLSLLVLRWKKPTLQRPYRAPFNIPVGKHRRFPLTALVGLVATFAVWMVVIITKPEGRYLGLLWLIAGFAMYFFYRRKKQLPVTGQLSIEKVKIPEYHPMHLKHILVITRFTGNTEALQTACQLAKSYGAQLTAKLLGGVVRPADKREYGRATVRVKQGGEGVFRTVPAGEELAVWASHGDHVDAIPPGFVHTAESDNCGFSGFSHAARKIHCVQFHPEVVHTPRGAELLGNWLFGVCGAAGDWSMASFVDEQVARIRARSAPKAGSCAGCRAASTRRSRPR